MKNLPQTTSCHNSGEREEEINGTVVSFTLSISLKRPAKELREYKIEDMEVLSLFQALALQVKKFFPSLDTPEVSHKYI